MILSKLTEKITLLQDNDKPIREDQMEVEQYSRVLQTRASITALNDSVRAKKEYEIVIRASPASIFEQPISAVEWRGKTYLFRDRLTRFQDEFLRAVITPMGAADP